MEKVYVYDTSALLNRFFFSDVAKAYITNDVISEIIDFEHKKILENKIAAGLLHIKDPESKYMELVRKITKKTNLSETDKGVLALAIELKGILVTDDRALFSKAVEQGLSVKNVFYPVAEMPDINKMRKIVFDVYESIKPTAEELTDIAKTSNKIVFMLENSAKKLKLPVKKIILAGSAARQTHLRKKQDLDFFILFDLTVNKENLEMYNRSIVETAFPGLKLFVDYGQHPYFKAKLFGYDVEFVPGYAITDIKQRKSSVDRTPLHLEFLQGILTDDQKRDIILFKQFLKNNLLYGADAEISGMPGYLVELFVVNYGSFPEVLKSISYWNKKAIIDIKNHYTGEPKFNDSLIVIDPVDSERNVAAAFSEKNYKALKFLIAEFAKAPSKKFFSGNVYEKYINKDELNAAVVFSFQKPEHKTEDALWGAAKALCDRLVKKALEKYVVIKKYSVLVDKDVKYVFYFDNEKQVHKGPEVTDKENATKFREKNKCVYIKDNRYYVDINLTKKQKVDLVKELLETSIKKVSISSIGNIKLNSENKKRLYKDFLDLENS